MPVTVTYGGFSGFRETKITKYSVDTDTSPDRAGRGLTRHVIEGDSLLVLPPYNNLGGTTMAECLTRLRTPGKDLRISIITGASTAVLVNHAGARSSPSSAPVAIDWTVEATAQGPYPSFSVVEVIGANTAMASWRFEFYARGELGSAVTERHPLAEFQVAFAFDIDNIGLTTITRTGFLKVDRYAVTAGTVSHAYPVTGVAAPRGPNASVIMSSFPDAYRRLVAGQIYEGMRRESQNFMLDESWLKMSWTVVDKEYPRTLPGPLRAATVDFEFERNIMAGDAAIGIKRFTAVVEGDSTVSAPALLAVAMTLSKARIQWLATATSSADIVFSCRMGEEDALNKNRVRLEIQAFAASKATPGEVWQPSSVTFGDMVTQLAAAGVTFKSYVPPDPYGLMGARAYLDSQKPPYDHDNPIATVYGDLLVSRTPTDGEPAPSTQIVIVPHVASTSQFPGEQAGVTANTGTSPAAAMDNRTLGYVDITGDTNIEVADTGMVVIPSQSQTSADTIFQVRKPIVYLRQNLTVVRNNKPPDSLFMAFPDHVLKSQSFVTSSGRADAQGNRVYTTRFTRVYQAMNVAPTAVPTALFSQWWTQYLYPTWTQLHHPSVLDIDIGTFDMGATPDAYVT